MGDAASPRASSSGAPSGTTRRVKAPQVPILTAAYQRNPYPSAVEKKVLCDALNLSLRYVDRWFSDRRFLDRKEGLVIGSAEEPRLKCGRRVFGRSQRRALNAAYHRDPRPSPAGHRHLSRQLGVPVFRIRNWFARRNRSEQRKSATYKQLHQKVSSDDKALPLDLSKPRGPDKIPNSVCVKDNVRAGNTTPAKGRLKTQDGSAKSEDTLVRSTATMTTDITNDLDMDYVKTEREGFMAPPFALILGNGRDRSCTESDVSSSMSNVDAHHLHTANIHLESTNVRAQLTSSSFDGPLTNSTSSCGPNLNCSHQPWCAAYPHFRFWSDPQTWNWCLSHLNQQYLYHQHYTYFR